MQLDKTTTWPEKLKVHKSAMLRNDFTDFQLAQSDNILFSRELNSLMSLSLFNSLLSSIAT